MDLVEQIIELRRRISEEIDYIDRRREDIKSKRLKPKDLETILMEEKNDGFPTIIEKKLSDLVNNYRMLETYPVTLAFIVLKELDNSNIRSKDDYFKIMYSVCKKKIDEFIDKYLERSRGWRSDYIKINEKLKKIQTIVTSPKNISDESAVDALFDSLDLDLIEISEEDRDKLKVRCIEEVIKKLNIKKKELEQEKREIKQASEEAKIEEEKIEPKVVNYEDEFKKKIKNFEKIQDVYDKWSYLFPSELFMNDIESRYDTNDLFELLSLKYPDFDEEWYIISLLTLLKVYNNENSDYNVERTRRLLERFSKQYELYLEVKNIEELKKKIWNQPGLTDDDTNVLAGFDAKVRDIVANNALMDDDIEKELRYIKKVLHEYNKISVVKNISEDGKIPITSFVFFDYGLDSDTGEKKAYVTTDLDIEHTRNLIDKSIDMNKIESNGYDDYCELIDDLLIYGKPKILLNTSFHKTNRIISNVYYTDDSHKSVTYSKENASDMVRIRPNLTSYVRFIDEGIILDPGSKKLLQVKELIESKYPSVNIDETKPFNLYINFLSMFKRADKSNYNKSFDRNADSKLLDVLKEEKERFTNEDLKYISEMIDFTMKTYSDLEKMNKSFDFSLIKTIKNKKLD